MNYYLLVALVPLIGGFIYFFVKALGWHTQLVAREVELVKAREETAEQKSLLERTKKELEKFAKFLEERVAQRTSELKAAQDEIARLRGK